jgi:hypothetical protein
MTAPIHSAGSEVGVVYSAGKHVVRESHGVARQRKLRVNHGSFRGPRKHLVNPTLQHPFEAQELPV